MVKIFKFLSVRRTTARSEWSCIGKIIQSKLRNFRVKSSCKHSICSFTTSSSGREMSNNTTTAPIFFNSFPSLWLKYPPPPVQNFSPLEHTNIHSYISFPTQILFTSFHERACIRPAATYLCYS